jgi:hypothetical protein
MWLYCPGLMYMPFLMLRKRYFSDKDGGGDLGRGVGIVPNTMITDGLIIVILHPGIKEYLMIGEMVIATIPGAVILGILLTSITAILTIIGVVVIGVQIMAGSLPDLLVDATYMVVDLVEVGLAVVLANHPCVALDMVDQPTRKAINKNHGCVSNRGDWR